MTSSIRYYILEYVTLMENYSVKNLYSEFNDCVENEFVSVQIHFLFVQINAIDFIICEIFAI